MVSFSSYIDDLNDDGKTLHSVKYQQTNAFIERRPLHRHKIVVHILHRFCVTTTTYLIHNQKTEYLLVIRDFATEAKEKSKIFAIGLAEKVKVELQIILFQRKQMLVLL